MRAPVSGVAYDLDSVGCLGAWAAHAVSSHPMVRADGCLGLSPDGMGGIDSGVLGDGAPCGDGISRESSSLPTGSVQCAANVTAHCSCASTVQVREGSGARKCACRGNAC
eukprot:scaffold13993_cov51-Attheya_sp.AAC.3